MNLVFNLGYQELLLLSIILVPIILPVFALIDILRSEFKGNDKLIWILIVLFLPVMGSILYYFIGRFKKV
jgi:hypothetical protein